MVAKTDTKICRLMLCGKLSYPAAWELQQKLAARHRQGQGQDTLILLEHPPVYTLGRAGSWDNVRVPDSILAAAGLEVLEVDRGGDITYHGPGQLVGYPVLNLKHYGRDLHQYSWMLEEVLIRTLGVYHIDAFREPGLPGVWTRAGKIAAIGIGVHNWVSMHGFALNVSPDMKYFSLIHPCGIIDRPVAAMQDFGTVANLAEVKDTLARQFAAVFGVKLLPAREETGDEFISAGSSAGN
ncbi:MAG TPA: lipoyl(octanoyl) transferase LipB [Patescibacteria group bacterium]|nr:lipoyl(octanoyl) transferase LipB [Patescibacteria group bacterium]